MGALPHDAREFMKRFLRAEDDIRRLKMRPSGTTDGPSGGPFDAEHTLQFYGEVFPGVYVPPMVIAVNSDGATPEQKWTVDGGFFTFSGVVTINWKLNGATFFPSGGGGVQLHNEDQITVAVASGAGVHLTAWLAIKVIPGTD